METKVLDCGHEVTLKHEVGATGVAYDSEGNTMCYDCAKNHVLRDMRETGKATLYLDREARHVVTWDGQEISRTVCIINDTRGSLGDRRLYFRFRFEGEIWTGMGLGGGMCCRVKRTKLMSIFA